MTRPKASTTHMLVNPDMAHRAANPHRSVPGQKSPVIITDTSEEADRAEREEDEEEFEEDELDEEEEGEEEEDSEGYEPVRARQPPRSILTTQLQETRNEKTDLLIRLQKIISRKDRISAVIPNKTYNLDTPVSELREVVELGESLIREHIRQTSENFGIQRLNEVTCGLAGMIEAANINYLDPENQFAVDGFHGEITRVVEKGDFEEIHRRIWDIVRDKLNVVDNPFLQWGLVFGGSLISYNNTMKKAYQNGALPDPRVRRAQIAEEEEAGLEEGLEDRATLPPGTSPAQPKAPPMPVSNMGIGAMKFGGMGPTPMAASDSEEEESGAGYGVDDSGDLDF